MSHYRLLVVGVCLLLAGFLVTPVGAFVQPLPTVNLGLTSFLDGGPPAGPGFYYTGYLQYYTADELVRHPSPVLRKADVDVWAYLNQFIYQSDEELLLGGKWGIDVIVPIVEFDSSPNIDNGMGIGDVLVGPFLQWDPIMGPDGPRFMHRVELQMIFPLGKYDEDEALNPGSNFFSFNPYWAGTYFFTPRLTASARLHYLWNCENDDPYTALGLSDAEAGDAFHANFALGYEFIPKKLRAGLNGYYLKQMTDTKANGSSVGTREQVLGIGPGALWSFSQDTHLFFNLYFETDTKYRPEGERFVLRCVHHF
jgi:anthranilate 1,2-dioxygenase (deaminating, decarboxylating) large subunit